MPRQVKGVAENILPFVTRQLTALKQPYLHYPQKAAVTSAVDTGGGTEGEGPALVECFESCGNGIRPQRSWIRAIACRGWRPRERWPTRPRIRPKRTTSSNMAGSCRRSSIRISEIGAIAI